jgi:hypothetical protein
MMRPILISFALIGLTFGISSCEYAQGDREIDTDPQPLPKGGGIFTGRSGEWKIIGR